MQKVHVCDDAYEVQRPFALTTQEVKRLIQHPANVVEEIKERLQQEP